MTRNLKGVVPGRSVVFGSFGNGGTSDGSNVALSNSAMLQIWSVTPSAIAGVHQAVSRALWNLKAAAAELSNHYAACSV